MSLRYTQDSEQKGNLQISVRVGKTYLPVSNAKIAISYSGEPDSTIEEIVTDSSGITPKLELNTPPLELSMAPGNVQPYSEYTLKVDAEGFDSIVISGVELLSGVTALQNVELKQKGKEIEMDKVVIGPHTLYGEYPPKIAEAEIKPVSEAGEIVLSKVVIPEFVIVHDGPPTDSSAMNYYVRYKDYIKNVASSEIYATWPVESIRANILAIMSFTLNRVYTEWYRNKGYNFTITSSTAYDHKWIYGRNFFDTISAITDELFSSYLSRPNVKQPILTQYCDGKNVVCPNWLSQWGSQTLGEQGYSAIQIIRNYYGDNMYVNSAEEVAGVPSSWPGNNLTVGSSGEKVKQMQDQLNKIASVYVAVPQVAADGVYGQKTQESVKAFQRTFGLPETGVVDYKTWYKISEVYVGITRIAELV